jgi:hypothetical protein
MSSVTSLFSFTQTCDGKRERFRPLPKCGRPAGRSKGCGQLDLCKMLRCELVPLKPRSHQFYSLKRVARCVPRLKGSLWSVCGEFIRSPLPECSAGWRGPAIRVAVRRNQSGRASGCGDRISRVVGDVRPVLGRLGVISASARSGGWGAVVGGGRQTLLGIPAFPKSPCKYACWRMRCWEGVFVFSRGLSSVGVRSG